MVHAGARTHAHARTHMRARTCAHTSSPACLRAPTRALTHVGTHARSHARAHMRRPPGRLSYAPAPCGTTPCCPSRLRTAQPGAARDNRQLLSGTGAVLTCRLERRRACPVLASRPHRPSCVHRVLASPPAGACATVAAPASSRRVRTGRYPQPASRLGHAVLRTAAPVTIQSRDRTNGGT